MPATATATAVPHPPHPPHARQRSRVTKIRGGEARQSRGGPSVRCAQLVTCLCVSAWRWPDRHPIRPLTWGPSKKKKKEKKVPVPRRRGTPGHWQSSYVRACCALRHELVVGTSSRRRARPHPSPPPTATCGFSPPHPTLLPGHTHMRARDAGARLCRGCSCGEPSDLDADM